MVETFRVKGMHCAACASAVERILKKQEGIQDAQVNLVSEQVTVTSDRYLTLEPLVQALGKAGYELERIEGREEAVERLDDVLFHKIPYISDYI